MPPPNVRHLHHHPALRVLAAALAALLLPSPSAAQFPDFGGSGGKGSDPSSDADATDPLAGLATNDTAQPTDPISIDATPIRTTLNPGGELTVAVTITTDEGWKVWPGQGQDALRPDVDQFAVRTKAGIGTPKTTTSSDPAAFILDRPGWIDAVGQIQWPQPVDIPNPLDAGQTTTKGFKGQATAYIPIILAADAPIGTHTLPVSVLFQACDEATCLRPETRTIDLTIEIVQPGQPATLPQPNGPEHTQRFAGFDDAVFAQLREGEPRIITLDAFGWTIRLDASGAIGMALLLAVAALGGLLLNFTPCVLPVIPLKIMGLANSAKNPPRTLLLGTVMSAGVVCFWLALGALIAFISGFDAISSLFQMPAFTLGVGVFIAAMAVGMLGLFTVNLPKAAYLINPSHETIPGSFVFGIMTAILSTPCTAPFMGGAAAWAAAQENKAIVLATFAAIGTGMALPYFILSVNPQWVSKLPKSGPGAETVKQVMALLMLAVAAFFFGTGLTGVLTTPPDPPSKLYWWLVAAFAAAAGAWLVYKAITIAKRPIPRFAFSAVGLAIAAAGVASAASFTASGPINWTYYTPERLQQAAARGDTVVVDFTAEWCLNCKALEKAVLYRDAVAQRLNGPGITPIKVDLTGNNPNGQQLLKDMGAVAIPLLTVLAPDDAGSATPNTRLVFKSDAYTVPQVLNAIEQAHAANTADEHENTETASVR